MPAATKTGRLRATIGFRLDCEPGKYADLAVLPDDYLTVAIEKIGELHSVLTLVGGKAVYGEGPFGASEGQ